MIKLLNKYGKYELYFLILASYNLQISMCTIKNRRLTLRRQLWCSQTNGKN